MVPDKFNHTAIIVLRFQGVCFIHNLHLYITKSLISYSLLTAIYQPGIYPNVLTSCNMTAKSYRLAIIAGDN